MNHLQVDSRAGTLSFRDRTIACAIGHSGTCPASEKIEGDGRTPLGSWPLRGALFRRGRSERPINLALPWRWIGQQDGWSDDPVDPCYNRPIRLPSRYGAERLIRNDPLYDIIVVLGHNDAPPVPGEGSAIFFHIWNEGKPTEGCVAISRLEMENLLPKILVGDHLVVR